MKSVLSKLLTIGRAPVKLPFNLGGLIPLPVLVLAVLVAILSAVPNAYFHQDTQDRLDTISTQLYILNYKNVLEEQIATSSPPIATATPSPTPRVVRKTAPVATPSGEVQ